jgi:signal recognition particle subunit SRP54
MFDALSQNLTGIFDRLKKRGALSESDVGTALREIRTALLEADVALPVVKDFIAKARERALGQEVMRSVTPGQQVVKIVNDVLVETLGGTAHDIDLTAPAPVPVLMVGLQGSGKTTTTAKIARRLAKRENKKPLVASLDTQRPAAQDQLARLAEQAGVDALPIVKGQDPVAIAKRAMSEAKKGGYDVVLLDTAGRLSIDEDLMEEVRRVRDVAMPHETLLVADAMTGQDAVTTAENFAERVGITGLVLTRMDGDARGGAALSMRQVTGQPIKLLGTSEKLDGLEAFDPTRLASRILGMGDVVSLVEKAQEAQEQDEAERLQKRLEKGKFDLEDLAGQLRQMRRMGGMGELMGLLPGVGKVKKQMQEANVDERQLKHQEALISSMTPAERKNPKLLNASRKRRIAAGAGLTVAQLNRLLKSHQQMVDMMKRAKKGGRKGGMKGGQMPGGQGGQGMGLPPGMFPPGGMQ